MRPRNCCGIFVGRIRDNSLFRPGLLALRRRRARATCHAARAAFVEAARDAGVLLDDG
jgi:hypothetical protein